MQNKKIKIGIITTWFSPKRGVAVNRMEAFSKYLDKDSFDVTFFTTGKDVGGEKHNHCTIVRKDIPRLLKLPDFQVLSIKPIHYFKVIWKLVLLNVFKVERHWANQIYKSVVSSNRKKKFDVIISCYAPIDCHEVGFKFKSQYPTVKWILDNRDEMSENPTVSLSIIKRLRSLEKKYNDCADVVISVSQPFLDGFIQNMQMVKRFEVVKNGFDHNYYNPNSVDSKVFVLNYVGSFYSPNKPDLLLTVIRELRKKGELKDIKIRFVGTQGNFSVPTELSEVVEMVEQVGYDEVIKFCDQAHLNLLLLNFPGRKGVFSGKIYDYISVGRPILGLVNKSDVAAELLSEVSCNFVVDPNDKDGIAQSILKAYSNWEKGIEERPSREWIASHHRKLQIEKLNQIIKAVV